MSYRNVFEEIGIAKEAIDKRLKEIVEEFFYGENRIYHAVGSDLGYLEDTGNHDARTEGMSYGMMMCVQLDMKEEFDRIWKWAKTNMFLTEGWNKGYFAWSCHVDGTKNSDGPAPDGEEFFAMALLFASNRWGNGDGIFNYEKEAKELLHTCIHKGEPGLPGDPMWNLENHQILFVPGFSFSDPSYHLPHFYELFAKWGNEEDREFWLEAAKASRAYLKIACHEDTGMSAEYAHFDGSPVRTHFEWGDHDKFYSDSYRTVANIGLDYEWMKTDIGQCKAAEKLQYFLHEVHGENPFMVYEIDGTRLEEEALHPVGLLATLAQASLAIPESFAGEKLSKRAQIAKSWVTRFWNTPMRTGDRRYYDNCLYLFAFLALSGNYRIYEK